MVKRITYRGVEYRRYDGRSYYIPGGAHILRGGTSLHRQVWIDAHGPIPSGCVVHHLDHDCDNNDITNLAVVDDKEHARMHTLLRIERGGPINLLWANSDAGRAVLRDNARKMHANAPTRKLACVHCGKAFATKHPRQKTCSDKCSYDHISRVKNCEVCGVEFPCKTHSTKEVRTCSYQCGWVLRRRGVLSHG